MIASGTNWQGEAVSYHACNCVGPKNGQPLCPCRMKAVIVRDGRYIMPERDLGPVRKRDPLTAAEGECHEL